MLHVMMLKYSTYLMDLQHAMAEHCGVLSAMNHDMKVVATNLNDDQIDTCYYMTLPQPGRP